MSLIWNVRFEPICRCGGFMPLRNLMKIAVAPPILAGRVVAREGV
jgi:hypothetical protein